MPIDVTQGEAGFKKANDPNDPQYTGGNQTETQARTNWSEDIFKPMFAGVIPLSITIEDATGALFGAAVGMSQAFNGGALANAFNVAAAILGNGMIGHIATPPIFEETDFFDDSLNAPGVNPGTAAITIMAKIQLKALTGTAFILPFGPTINWS